MPNEIYVITNREIHSRKRGFDKFGKEPNQLGSHELRIARIAKRGNDFDVKIVPEPAREAMKDGTAEPPSLKEARKLFETLSSAGTSATARRNLLLFVHGFNNDMEAVVKRAFELRRLYKVEVVAFSWPANGGGVTGVPSYKSDKRDARASVGALDRVLEKLRNYLEMFRHENVEKIRAELRLRYPDNPERIEAALSRRALAECPVKVSLMCHSMGNYLLKNLLQSSVYQGRTLIFDNIVLAAADTNNLGHHEWIDRLQVRNRVYVAINEKDGALMASRMKGGDEQLARLGHYPYNLHSRQTVYVDFTGVREVEKSHAYFEGGPVRNARVKRFFHKAFHGETAESASNYDAARNLYRP